MNVKASSRKLLDSSLGIILFLLLWEALPRLGIVNPGYLSPPSAVVAAIFDLGANGELIKHLRPACGVRWRAWRWRSSSASAWAC